MDQQLIRERLPAWMEHVRRHLTRRLGGPRLAADVAQEAGLRLLHALDARVPLREPRAWLFRVAQNLAVDEIRRRAPQALGLEWQAKLVDPRVEEEDDAPLYRLAGREFGRDEVIALLPGALQELSPRDRLWLMAYYRDGGSCEGLAREHGVSLDASKVRLHRARRRLAQLLQRLARRRAAERAAACALLAACGPAGARGLPEAPPEPMATPQAALAPLVPSAAAIEPAAAPPAGTLEDARRLRLAAARLRGEERDHGLEAAEKAYAAAAAGDRAEAAEAHFRRAEILRMLDRDGEACGAFLEAFDAADAVARADLATRSLLELGRAQARCGNRRLAADWFARAAAREDAPLRLRNDAREELVHLRLQLAQWPEALALARIWRAEAETAAEEARAAAALARALRGAGRGREAAEVLADALRRAQALAEDPSPEGAAATRALRGLEALIGAADER